MLHHQMQNHNGGEEEDEEDYGDEDGVGEMGGDGTGKTPSKKRKKRAYKKAPDAPRRGRSAYVLFSMEAREKVKNDLPPGAK